MKFIYSLYICQKRLFIYFIAIYHKPVKDISSFGSYSSNLHSYFLCGSSLLS